MPLTLNGSGIIGGVESITMSNWSISNTSSGTNTVLDDYEEGTWNPYWSTINGTNLFTTTPTVYTSHYQRIGNVVYFAAFFGNTSAPSYNSGINGSTPNIGISGLPYTSVGYGMAYCSYYFNFVEWDSLGVGFNPMLYIESGTNFMYITYSFTETISYLTPGPLTGPESRIMVAGMYKCSA